MIKMLLNKTDGFLCESIKGAFSKVERDFSKNSTQLDLLQELKKFEGDPLSCAMGTSSDFQKTVKLKIKMVLGLFFVFIPLVVFTAFSYVVHIHFTYAFVATFFLALLVASRVEELATRYVHSRELEFSKHHLHH